LSVLGRWFRRLLLALVGLAVLFVALVAVAGYVLSGPAYSGPVSDHFDGTRFRNMRPVPHGGFMDFLRWQRTRKPGAWQDRNEPPGPKPPDRVPRGQLRVTFINHATVLIQQDGLNILTDPIWSERASPVGWLGPRRHQPPGIRFEDLPRIDVVLISHDHYDHMDLPTLRRLQEKHLPRFFVGLGNAPLFVDKGIGPVTELDWWKSTAIAPDVELVAVPAQHFSARGLFDRDRTLWLGYLVKGPAGISYFAGDTGDGPHYDEIKKRFGAPRLALLPIGAYQPAWFMSAVHQNPAEALHAHDRLGAGTSVGIHFGTFSLADDGQDEPQDALQQELSRRAAPRPSFLTLRFGEGLDVPAPAPAK
jgi:L-ascorbate metabolism protein UlaG (beta-lactamase superfamily)